MLSLTGLIIAT